VGRKERGGSKFSGEVVQTGLRQNSSAQKYKGRKKLAPSGSGGTSGGTGWRGKSQGTNINLGPFLRGAKSRKKKGKKIEEGRRKGSYRQTFIKKRIPTPGWCHLCLKTSQNT